MITSTSKIQRLLLAPRGGDPEAFVAGLAKGGEQFGISQAPIALIDVVAFAIQRMGRGIELCLASWWLSQAQSEDLCGMVQQGWLKSVRLVLDAGMRGRLPETAKMLDTRLGSSVSWGETHLKALTVRAPRTGECLTVMTSQADPGVQAEWWLTSSLPDVHSWLSGYLMGNVTADRLRQDVPTAMRLQAAPYMRRKGQQDAKSALVAGCVVPPIGNVGMIGGATVSPLGLVAGIAARMSAPRAMLIGWWLSGKSASAINILETSGLVSSSRVVVSSVQDGVYNQRASELMREVIPEGKRRYADNHAKMALLEDGERRICVLSTGNWQAESPRAELFWVTEDPSICAMVERYGAWVWGGCRGIFRG